LWCCLRLIRHRYVSYPTYLCFLKNIFLNDIFCSTTCCTKKHIYFNNIYICFSTTHICYLILSDICMSCILEQHICNPHVTYFCIFPHPSRLSWRSQRTNQWFNGHANWFFPQNISIVLSRLCSSSEMIFLPPVYTCLNGVALAQHLGATLQPRVIPWHIFECVCVRGEWDHYSLSRETIALRTPSTRASVILVEFESTHTEARLVVVGGLVSWFEAWENYTSINMSLNIKRYIYVFYTTYNLLKKLNEVWFFLYDIYFFLRLNNIKLSYTTYNFVNTTYLKYCLFVMCCLIFKHLMYVEVTFFYMLLYFQVTYVCW